MTVYVVMVSWSNGCEWIKSIDSLWSDYTEALAHQKKEQSLNPEWQYEIEERYVNM